MAYANMKHTIGGGVTGTQPKQSALTHQLTITQLYTNIQPTNAEQVSSVPIIMGNVAY